VLNVGNQSTPAYTSIIYSQGNGVADFYVESIAVSTSQQQCKPK
jgi:subtilase family serine protease